MWKNNGEINFLSFGVFFSFFLFLNTRQIGVIYEKSEFRFKIQIISWTQRLILHLDNL